MKDILPFQQKFLQSKNAISTWQCKNPNNITLEDVVKNCHPTVLVGVSGQPGAFTENVVREMAAHVDRPVIFPLSNPTSRSEATPTDLINWTNGRAVIGTGSPFADIVRDGQSFRVDQTNNSYIFPGMGLGLIAVKAKCVTDKMFMLAAKALANCSPAKQNPKANLLPPLTTIRDVSYQVALATAKEAVNAGLADKLTDEEIVKRINDKMWVPTYLPYKKVNK